MTMTDSCPNCCERGVTPAAERRNDTVIVHGYQCPSCGHCWATSRLLSVQFAGGKGEYGALLASQVAPIEITLVEAAGEPIESIQPSLPDAARGMIPFASAVPQAVCSVPLVTAE